MFVPEHDPQNGLFVFEPHPFFCSCRICPITLLETNRTLESTFRGLMQNPLFLPQFSKNVVGQKGQKYPIFQGSSGTEILKKLELRGQKLQFQGFPLVKKSVSLFEV